MVVYIYKIDYKKIEENIKSLDKSDYLVLKSNAYGFGFKNVLDICYRCGIRKFCVLEIEDSIYIKTHYHDSTVLLLGPLNKKHLKAYQDYQIDITITDIGDLDIISKYNIPYQIEINSGMNRFGLSNYNFDLIKDDLRFKGVYSHNATKDIYFINDQIQYFFNVVRCLNNKEIHFASSSIKNMKIPFVTARRIGCDIYQDSLSVYGRIIQINYCIKDSYLGYDYSYKLTSDSYIGVINIGYADGLDRECYGFMVWIKNKYYPLIGKACMNHSFVLLENDKCLNHKAIIIGKDNNIENYVKYFNKIPHQIYLSFLKRY